MASLHSLFTSSASEEYEVTEYEKIVAFAEAVMAGTHPRVQITPIHRAEDLMSQHKAPVSATGTAKSSLATRAVTSIKLASEVQIDFKRDYYKDLGVAPHVRLSSIYKAYHTLFWDCAPSTKNGKRKWSSSKISTRNRVQRNWDRIQTAKAVLFDPTIRARYDAGRQQQHQAKLQVSLSSATTAENRKPASNFNLNDSNKSENKRPCGCEEDKSRKRRKPR